MVAEELELAEPGSHLLERVIAMLPCPECGGLFPGIGLRGGIRVFRAAGTGEALAVRA
jgi:hypothetical protein